VNVQKYKTLKKPREACAIRLLLSSDLTVKREIENPKIENLLVRQGKNEDRHLSQLMPCCLFLLDKYQDFKVVGSVVVGFRFSALP